MTFLESALDYAQRGFPVFPYAAGTRTPLISRENGGHGYKDGTTDSAVINDWWKQHPTANIGINLQPLHILMLDIDRNHSSGADGVNELAKHGRLVPTYMENSSSGGLHVFYKYEGDLLTSKTNLFSHGHSDVTGIDFTALGVPIAPDVRGGAAYTVVPDMPLLENAAPCPNWIIDEIRRNTRKQSFKTNFATIGSNYTGQLLNKIVNGVDAGNRDNWLISIIGSLVHSGMTPENTVIMADTINLNFVRPPLPDAVVAQKIKSVFHMEAQKRR
jgi:hypothetical protein